MTEQELYRFFLAIREDAICVGIDAGKLRSRILGDRYNGAVFACGGDHYPVYLVGGYMRDTLLGRECFDRDFVVEVDHNLLAGKVHERIGGKIFCLGNGRLHRIILEDGTSLDFSTVSGDIYADLSIRDFSINAIAWSPAKGLIDPNGGLKDLEAQSIRMICADNLKCDPVRIIRAYRFGGELSFGISHDTRMVLKEMGKLLSLAKSERITLEFFKILNLRDPSEALRLMLSDGILQQLISATYSELQLKLKVLSNILDVFDVLPSKYREGLSNRYSQNLLQTGLLRLEILLMGASRHLFALSSKVAKRVVLVERGDRLLSFGVRVKDVLFDLFQILDGAAVDFVLIKGMPELLSQYESFSDIMREGLLSTEEIEQRTGLSQGVTLGNAIENLKRVQFDGKITTKDDAIKFIQDCRDEF